MKKILTVVGRIIGFLLVYLVGTGLAIALMFYPPFLALMLIREFVPFGLEPVLAVELLVLLPLFGALFMGWMAVLQWGLQQFRTPRFVERTLLWIFDLDAEDRAAS